MRKLKPQEVFDRCHAKYVQCVHLLDGRASTINPMASAKRSNRPFKKPKLADFVADFERAGERVLKQRPTWRPRLILFRVYFCGGEEYRAAIRRLKCKEGTFDRWAWEVKLVVGEELRRAGLFPTWRYFKELVL